ncbi:MAG: hypothetical protein QF844_06920 [Acidimicrobiales bacterium]|nr:hypothetical protein [Acidimicrobiales bacterium]
MRGPIPAVLFAVLLVGVSCGGDGPVDGPPMATGSMADGSEVVASATTIPQMVTNGWVQVGDQSFDMEFTCYSPGPGDVAAIGVGRHPDSGQPVEALIQGFLGQPYVGLTIGGSVRYEASLDAPLQVFVHDGTISAGAIEWMRGLDLDSGVGERIGYGAVFVSCGEYVHDLPEGY